MIIMTTKRDHGQPVTRKAARHNAELAFLFAFTCDLGSGQVVLASAVAVITTSQNSYE